LVAPGIPKAAEKSLMKKMNSYGETWHAWNTGMEGQAGDKLPMGGPMLAWSFNRDGEALPGMVEKRDKTMGIDSTQVRGDRADLHPPPSPSPAWTISRASPGVLRAIFRVSSTVGPAQRQDESSFFTSLENSHDASLCGRSNPPQR
jgi:hypothetical protein